MPALSEVEGKWSPTAPLEGGEQGVGKRPGTLRFLDFQNVLEYD